MNETQKPLINSEIVDAFVKEFEDFGGPGDSFRSCVRVALVAVAQKVNTCGLGFPMLTSHQG